jgi:hypothetical protein
MKKVVLIFGSISGIIAATLLMISVPYMLSGELKGSMGWGFTSQIIALIPLFFGIKAYRDKYKGGNIKFINGFGVGMLIVLIASIIYAIGWEISLMLNDITGEEFMAFMAECEADSMAKDGASSAEIARMKAETIALGQTTYSNPVFRFMMTMAEMLPVGIIISLVSALVLKKKEILPAYN